MKSPFLAGVALLSACDNGPVNTVVVTTDTVASTAGTRQSRDASPALSGAAPTPESDAATANDAAQVEQAKLAVDGEGLRLIDPRSGSAGPLPFGTPKARVLFALERLRGSASQGRNVECSADYANWADGLGLNFERDRFVGWTLDGRAEGALATMAGIGPGSTRADLDAAYTAKLSRSTLGTEFSAGGFSGLLTGPRASATITNMWAGTVCLAR